MASDNDFPEEDYSYPLVGGLACPKCDCPAMVDVGLVRSKSKKRTRRVRKYLCPACLGGTIVPKVVGEREVMSYVTAINTNDVGGVRVALLTNNRKL